jgi:large subunit ribosomal protein L11
MQKPKIHSGKLLPVVITVFKDKSFDFVVKTPPAAIQLLELAKVAKGSPESNRKKVGTVSWVRLKKLQKLKCRI